MGDELDTVFVALNHWNAGVARTATLEWAFTHFARDKTKIILTAHWLNDDHRRGMFIDLAQNTALPRCRTEQFKAEILTLQASEANNTTQIEATLKLLTKHGMKKLVIDRYFMSEISEAVDRSLNFSLKIWFVNPSTSILESTRVFGQDPDLLQKAQMEVEKFKKIAAEETMKSKMIEEKLVIMTEQAKTNEQRITYLTQENEQLRQNTALSTYINFQELEKATQNFSASLKIGDGGSGSVYRGTFRGTTVAIKQFISQNEQVLADFKKEVVILSTTRHPNLVTLMGVCSDPPVLVYEYLSNESLHDHLNHMGRPLHWQTRTRIIGEICLALIYLHSNKPDPIIHGDLKPDNVYLDANFTSKLSDFGLIKQAYFDTANLFRTTDPERTFAYMDPRFLKTGKMTKESDIYSFGVIILRLVTGKSPLDICETVEESMGNNQFPSMIDESAKWPEQQAQKMAKIGIRCAHDSWTKRPHLVNEVWPIIEGLLKFPDEMGG